MLQLAQARGSQMRGLRDAVMSNLLHTSMTLLTAATALIPRMLRCVAVRSAMLPRAKEQPADPLSSPGRTSHAGPPDPAPDSPFELPDPAPDSSSRSPAASATSAPVDHSGSVDGGAAHADCAAGKERAAADSRSELPATTAVHAPAAVTEGGRGGPTGLAADSAAPVARDRSSAMPAKSAERELIGAVRTGAGGPALAGLAASELPVEEESFRRIPLDATRPGAGLRPEERALFHRGALTRAKRDTGGVGARPGRAACLPCVKHFVMFAESPLSELVPKDCSLLLPCVAILLVILYCYELAPRRSCCALESQPPSVLVRRAK